MRRLLVLILLVFGCDDRIYPDVKDVNRIEDSRIFRAELEIQKLETEVGQYYALKGEWPKDWRALRRGCRDPWGAEYILEIENERPIVFSAGPDGKLDTEDDVYIRER